MKGLSGIVNSIVLIGLAEMAGAQAGFHHSVEPVYGSEIPVSYYLVEAIDGVYTPIGLRTPHGEGPFPVVLFASGNGGGGLSWLRRAAEEESWTLDRFLEAGYAVAWMRYRAEVELGYNKAERLVQDVRQGRQLLNRGPLEIDDVISIIEYVKALPFIDANRVGYLGLSHGGEMALKITSQYNGLAAAVANEPAAHEFLSLSPDDTAFISSESGMWNIENMQMRQTEKVRDRVDLNLARERISHIQTPIMVHGRDDDHLQGIFRLSYELLEEAGKETRWVSYDHPEHGFIYVDRDQNPTYEPDEVQIQAINDSIAWFDEYLK